MSEEKEKEKEVEGQKTVAKKKTPVAPKTEEKAPIRNSFSLVELTKSARQTRSNILAKS